MAGADFLPRDPEAGGAGATLGARIARAREATDLTTAQLARRLGITTRTLNNWESDRSKPRPNRLVMLAGLLGVSPTWLMGGLGEGPATTESEVTILRRELDVARTTMRELETIFDAIDGRLARLAQTSRTRR